jgi:hypothetical protein
VGVVVAVLAMSAGRGAARAEGPGVKLGDSLVFHPGIALGAGWDSNLFYAPSGVSVIQRVAAWYLSVRPGLDLATRPAQRGGNEPHMVDFRLHAALPIRVLLSDNTNINRHYSLGVDAGLLLSINPFGTWSFDLFDNFLRSSEPPYAVVQANFTSSQAENINLDTNIAGLRLRYRPGGQRFETTVQYDATLYFFESAPLSPKTSLLNEFLLRLKWNFFPKTALYLNADEAITTYPVIDQANALNRPPTSYPFRVVAGLIGLITAKFKTNLNVGYGNSFTQTNPSYPATKSYSNVVALVEFTWNPTVLTNITLSYRHDFAPALIGTFYDLDAAYLSFGQAIWRFNVALRFAYEHRGFRGDLRQDGLKNLEGDPNDMMDPGKDTGGINRKDDLLTLHAQLDYPIKDWLFVGVGYDLAKNFSNCEFVPDPTNNAPSLARCDYIRHDVWLRLSLLY